MVYYLFTNTKCLKCVYKRLYFSSLTSMMHSKTLRKNFHSFKSKRYFYCLGSFPPDQFVCKYLFLLFWFLRIWRTMFSVDPDMHIDSLEQAEAIVLEGTSKWSCKIEITGQRLGLLGFTYSQLRNSNQANIC